MLGFQVLRAYEVYKPFYPPRSPVSLGRHLRLSGLWKDKWFQSSFNSILSWLSIQMVAVSTAPSPGSPRSSCNVFSPYLLSPYNIVWVTSFMHVVDTVSFPLDCKLYRAGVLCLCSPEPRSTLVVFDKQQQLVFGQVNGQLLWPQTSGGQRFDVNLVLRLPNPES